MTVEDRRRRFRELHQPGAPLVMPNPWDLGSARVLESLGAVAFGTTSSGFAFTLGRPDREHVSADEALAHAAAVHAAVSIPVSADLESGYGATPETVAATVRRAAEIGLAGCSIEDTDHPHPRSYAFDATMARAKAAIEAAGESGIVLTLRADGLLYGAYDEAEAVRRCLAMAELGADVIYAPLASAEALKAMAASGTPVNALAVGDAAKLEVKGLAALGVARISFGGALARLTQRVLIDAGRAALSGELSALLGGASGAEVDAFLSR
ncbi:isocitrate lyase/phosphoenolpyruvate mutase family protein [Pikeienuella piscinae]|uniref:Isocitrate lyase/phosphoenolpyruvate mutase family protein n=2 Tax=Pikeienuella piscinae TaxID=2748098 RepID=A0A7M3T6T0_9RHOB|nr:isocitrate lyase/phosphoenolpyruvate mutase family protein [Pikeienuella piscinae]